MCTAALFLAWEPQKYFFFLRTTRLRIVGLSDEISTKRIAYGVNDLSHLVLLIIFKTLNVLMTVDA